MEEKNKKNQGVAEFAAELKCLTSLWLDFERDFDPVIFESMARKQRDGRTLPAGWCFLGEGADQTAFARTCGQVDYALSIPKTCFLTRQRDEGRAWLAALTRLRDEARRRLFLNGEDSLVPPMQVSKNPVAVIMPRGQQSLQSEAIDAKLMRTRALLEDLGLELGDRPQIAVWRGQPFIYDWSDLRAIRPANRR